jgi:hypothetical protein
VAFIRMEMYISILLLVLFPFVCFGQEKKQQENDSIFTYADSPSEFRLKMLENCENAFIIADQDIKKNRINLLIVGGITPVVYPSDQTFEEKYQVTYSDYGDLAAKGECMFNYNSKVFDYLTKKYGKTWRKEVRKDVYGLKEWKKRKRK